MVDLQPLLEAVSAELPSGESLEYDAAYLEIAKAIQGKPEDPITGEKAQPPNWRDIDKSARELLNRSKDIQVAIYLARALIHLEGINGFRDGVILIRDLLEKYWDTIHPQLDPEDAFDPTARVNILEELANFDSFLRPLSLVALVESKAVGRFGLRDIHIATDKISVTDESQKVDLATIKAAFLDQPDLSLSNYQALGEALAGLDNLQDFVNQQVGATNGPDLSALKAQLKEMRFVFEQYAEFDTKTDAEQEILVDEDGGAEAGATLEVRKVPFSGGIHSRQDVIKTLDMICRYYAEHEPSSPVPIFLERAKHLVTADFRQIVQNLLPDAMSQLDVFKGPDTSTD